jgi:pantoate--beta-alanine ligase
VLYRALTAAARAVEAGERRGDEIRRILREVLESEPLARIEYAEAVDGGTFQPLDVLYGNVTLPLAVRIGGTRLIDNFQMTV